MKRTELKRGTKGLSRGKGLNRGKGLSRSGAMKKARPSKMSPSEAEFARRFKLAAWEQGVCAVTGKGGGWSAHHVVYRQHLEDRGLFVWDPRDALRVMVKPHLDHHNRVKGKVIKTKMLTDDNIAYAAEVLGDYAPTYLRMHYDDSDPDPRLVALDV